MTERGAGPDRRAVDRTPAPRVLGRARVSASFPRTRTAPLSRGRWYPAIEQPPDVLTPPLAGYVWIDDGTRPRSVWAAFLELELQNFPADQVPGSASRA